MNPHCIFRLSALGFVLFYLHSAYLMFHLSLLAVCLFVCLFVGFLDKATVTSMIQFVMVPLPLSALFTHDLEIS